MALQNGSTSVLGIKALPWTRFQLRIDAPVVDAPAR